jgi:hypothetical protein
MSDQVIGMITPPSARTGAPVTAEASRELRQHGRPGLASHVGEPKPSEHAAVPLATFSSSPPAARPLAAPARSNGPVCACSRHRMVGPRHWWEGMAQ